MGLIVTTRIEEARPGHGEDRITIVEASDRTLILVADGAGGVAGGAAAAEALCRALTSDVEDLAAWLKQQDAQLAEQGIGLAAAVVLSIGNDGTIHGASVGDCEAWLFVQGETLNLTEKQFRKPLLGDGAAVPVSFMGRARGGVIVVASDGLWKYMGSALIATAVKRWLEWAADKLVNGVRLRSGALQDDVAIAIGRFS